MWDAQPHCCYYLSGPGCSKLTTSLVNLLLNFQKLISHNHMPIFLVEKIVRSFCTAKASVIFSTKNISVLGYKVIKHLTSWPLNELVKLTMLWTTRPWPLSCHCFPGVLIYIFYRATSKDAVHRMKPIIFMYAHRFGSFSCIEAQIWFQNGTAITGVSVIKLSAIIPRKAL